MQASEPAAEHVLPPQQPVAVLGKVGERESSCSSAQQHTVGAAAVAVTDQSRNSLDHGGLVANSLSTAARGGGAADVADVSLPPVAVAADAAPDTAAQPPHSADRGPAATPTPGRSTGRGDNGHAGRPSDSVLATPGGAGGAGASVDATPTAATDPSASGPSFNRTDLGDVNRDVAPHLRINSINELDPRREKRLDPRERTRQWVESLELPPELEAKVRSATVRDASAVTAASVKPPARQSAGRGGLFGCFACFRAPPAVEQ